MFRSLVRHRFAVLAAWDALSWTVALVLAVWGRYEFEPERIHRLGVIVAVALVVVVQLGAGVWQGLYVGRYQLGSFEEIAALLRSALLAAAVLFTADVYPRWVPISTPVIAPFIALVGMAGLRYGWRLTIDQRRVPKGEHLSRVLLFGAGEGASQAVTAMLRDRDSSYLPVAIVDDDPRKQRLQVRGVPVRGTRADVARVAAAERADTMLIAIPSATGELVRELADIGVAAGLDVRVLPTVGDLFDGRIDVSDIRPVTEADLLGRREIDTDLGSIASYLSGQRVLVTGAGGSIGAELCRQVQRFGPARLVMLDRDESALHAVQLSIEGRALLDSRDLVVADIRDRARMDEVFDEHRPDVVFHAAALKHLSLLEMHPSEGVKTNVWGTQHLLDVALAHDVTTFVNISSDKAADPTSVLGFTKRISERLTAATPAPHGTAYLSVRFGNVLGSRGSVLTTFRAQVDAGGPITVTDAKATRYFMTVEEAVQLVIQAGAIGGAGEVLVLDMGAPVRIVDVARHIAESAERHIDIVFTGLRPGEKRHEVLHGADEASSPTAHPLISRTAVPPLAHGELAALADSDAVSLVATLHALCGSSRSVPS